MKTRGVEIPCPTCQTWSHFIQVNFKKILSTCPGTSLKKVNAILYFICFINYYELTISCHIENSVDPDQLASEEADLDIRCFQLCLYLVSYCF